MRLYDDDRPRKREIPSHLHVYPCCICQRLPKYTVSSDCQVVGDFHELTCRETGWNESHTIKISAGSIDKAAQLWNERMMNAQIKEGLCRPIEPKKEPRSGS